MIEAYWLFVAFIAGMIYCAFMIRFYGKKEKKE